MYTDSTKLDEMEFVVDRILELKVRSEGLPVICQVRWAQTMIPLSQLGMINGTDNFDMLLSGANITPDGDHVRIDWKDSWADVSMTDCDELIDDFWEFF
ncbi:hypothetical protein LTR09_010203 [Extremus antarcticus]|uniref:Uncharacterized protein n=1 Tax=Extremus antarcticus TaxID=702011 RepID=A0AAJ0DE29_9PEZI|nr:hypothetical protein LTR09_010203 [Extremus antarcticus]